MGIQLLLCLFLCYPLYILGEESVILSIDGTHAIAEIDENFICATLDWWPSNKCDYGQCPWGNASILNLNISHPFLAKAIQAFGHLRIRLGGSLEDQVLYGVPSLKSSCLPFHKEPKGLFGFSLGCLQMDRWDALNDFFNKIGAIITFGLNALYGRRRTPNVVWVGPWDSTNARDFINYTVSKGYTIDSWEFGNELSGKGIGASVDAIQYAKDLINLRGIIDELYKNSDSKALLLAPGGFYDEDWFTQVLQKSGSKVINALTHHIYNLGLGNDTDRVVQNILDPDFLSEISDTYIMMNKTIHKYGPWASAWVTEAGGAYTNGGPFVSHTFVNSIWYIDQLGASAIYSTKVYCRQSLIGGNYGLIDTTTFVPNPDYYSALLWSQLMGKKVLSIDIKASPYLRAYAHCTKTQVGVTLLLINLNTVTSYEVKVENKINKALHNPKHVMPKQGSLKRKVRKAISWVGSKVSNRANLHREEYHLTPKDGYVRSQTMVLNGKALNISENGDIPKLEPTLVSAFAPIHISHVYCLHSFPPI